MNILILLPVTINNHTPNVVNKLSNVCARTQILQLDETELRAQNEQINTRNITTNIKKHITPPPM